jgi:hypothetical protein
MVGSVELNTGNGMVNSTVIPDPPGGIRNPFAHLCSIWTPATGAAVTILRWSQRKLSRFFGRENRRMHAQFSGLFYVAQQVVLSQIKQLVEAIDDKINRLINIDAVGRS